MDFFRLSETGLSILLPTSRLGIARIMDQSNFIICSRNQIVRDCAYLSYLNTHKSYFEN